MIGARLSTHEAKRVVARTWGGNRIVCVVRRIDGGFDVQLLPAGVASDVRARNAAVHRLDECGRIICHDDCRQLEP